LPTSTPLNVSVDGFAVRLAGVAPVPERAMSNVVVDPPTVRESSPLLAPAIEGAKTTLKVELCPGVRINGNVRPTSLKPIPVTAACVIVRLSPPVLVKVSVWVWLAPTCTVPKEKLVGVPTKLPTATALPERGRTSGVPDESSVSDKLPLAAPTEEGAKRMLTVVLCPAAKVTGKVKPLKLNPAPLVVAWDRVRVLPPVLVSVSV